MVTEQQGYTDYTSRNNLDAYAEESRTNKRHKHKQKKRDGIHTDDMHSIPNVEDIGCNNWL